MKLILIKQTVIRIRVLVFCILISNSTFGANVPTLANRGMVVSVNELSSEIGIQIMKKGGSAVDAAVATAFALAVTHPTAGNIGGGGFLVYRPDEGGL